jgi:TonB family protein
MKLQEELQMRWIASFFLFTTALTGQTDSKTWINEGVTAFKSARYPEAVAAFQKAAELDPSSVTAHLYLGTAYMQQFIPGAESADNREVWRKAMDEFERVLALDAGNKVAMQSTASLNVKAKKWEEARSRYKQLLTVDPNNKEAYYTLGFIDWSQWYPAYSAARQGAGMRPEDPGPIADAALRASLLARWNSTLEDGIWNLNRALELDPKYDDAMAYLNLFLRERADLRDTSGEYQLDVQMADEWVRRALETKKEKAQLHDAGIGGFAPPPPPPGPAGGFAGGRVGGRTGVLQARIVTQVAPVYPPLALQARVQGTVRFLATIDRQGRVLNLQVQSGHPLLIQAAIVAAKQWVFEPTLLNGQPVEIRSELDVNFVLPN